MPKDPVCNMDVDETTAKYISEYKEKKYFFLRSWLQGDVRQRS
jgi:YHS domain-containing protein